VSALQPHVEALRVEAEALRREAESRRERSIKAQQERHEDKDRWADSYATAYQVLLGRADAKDAAADRLAQMITERL
jgi:hypothetical protein